MQANPSLRSKKAKIRDALWESIKYKFPTLKKSKFLRVWKQVEATGIIEKLIEAKAAKKEAPEDEPDRVVEEAESPALVEHIPTEEVDEGVEDAVSALGLQDKSLEELEAMLSDDLALNNVISLEMIHRPNFNRGLIVRHYNGLGVSVKLGKEGTYGKGIQRKRALNLQQFYTHPDVSKIAAIMLSIPHTARIYDPTAGSGRLFEHMPNHALCHGIEIETDAFDIAKALYPEAMLLQDDTTLHMFDDDFDYIVANPPFTLFWEDKSFLFKFAGFNNKVVSEVAVMEIAVRSLHHGGYIAMVMPQNVWGEKFQDKDDFMKWFTGQMIPVAKINLPSHTHEGTTWPTALYILQKSWHVAESNYQANIPVWGFVYDLDGFTNDMLDNLLEKWRDESADDAAKTYAERITPQSQLKIEPGKVETVTTKEYLTTAHDIKTDDVITLDTISDELNFGFNPVPILVEPNGIHALMKTVAISARHPHQWNASQKSYIDVFKERMLVLDAFLNPRINYDDLPLIKNYFNYDCAVRHSERFVAALDKRKEWMEFQNLPFEQWIDEDGTLDYKMVFANEGVRGKYPEVYNQFTDRFNELATDSRYVTYLPWISREANWLAYLFPFQKDDAIRMAMKSSVIYTAQMGLGKTRSAIATALLKGQEHNLIICNQQFISEWFKEFGQLGMEEPHEIWYTDDVDEALEHQFAIVTYETLSNRKRGKRPKGKKVRRNPSLEYNYDVVSGVQKLIEFEELSETMGTDIVLTPGRRNPIGDDDLTKEAERIIEMGKMYLFADNLKQKFEFVIADEAHGLSNPTTYRSEAVRRLLPTHWLFLTGTPIKNRVNGLLSMLVMGWGEDNYANPYTKKTFLEHFEGKIEIDTTYRDSHGYKKEGKKEVKVPKIENPDDLRTLMAGKWLRRVHYEPDVANDVTFPIPEIRIRKIKPSNDERQYARQWYDEYVRLREEIEKVKDEIKELEAEIERGGWNPELEQKIKEFRVLLALAGVIIGKLRFIALYPQRPFDELVKPGSSLRHWITHVDEYAGGITPRQHAVYDEIVERVEKGEQCYTIVFNDSFNYFFKEMLVKKGIKVEIIDGSLGGASGKAKRNKIISDFNDKKIDVICATIGTFAVGINIPHASYCAIIQPEWNWSDMNQAYSRMIRPQSQGTRTVDIFILEDTIEDYVQQLFEMKRVNLEYVLDYRPRPDDEAFLGWTQMVEKMFNELKEGTFSVA